MFTCFFFHVSFLTPIWVWIFLPRLSLYLNMKRLEERTNAVIFIKKVLTLAKLELNKAPYNGPQRFLTFLLWSPFSSHRVGFTWKSEKLFHFIFFPHLFTLQTIPLVLLQCLQFKCLQFLETLIMAPDSILSERPWKEKLSDISDTSDHKLGRHSSFVITECLSWHNFSLLLYYPSFSKIQRMWEGSVTSVFCSKFCSTPDLLLFNIIFHLHLR